MLKQTKLVHKVMEEIKNQIIRGELKEGEKLPPQDKCSEAMGVSRGTLREALNQLVLMGIIEMRQGSGTYVRSITPFSFMESLSPALLMDKNSAAELLDARLYIEGAVAFLAAKKATDGDIRELRKILDHMREALKANSIEDFINKDVKFHIAIAKSSKNRVLMRVVQTIRDILYHFIADYFTAMPETVKNAMDYHTRIYRALENRDPAEAKKQMESHIQSLIRRINRQVRNSPVLGGKDQDRSKQRTGEMERDLKTL